MPYCTEILSTRGWSLVTTPGKIFVGTTTSTDFGPACQKKITDSANVLVRVSDATSADVTIAAGTTEYWSTKAIRTGTAQAYGIAVFFRPEDISLLDPKPQTPIGTSIPSRTSSASALPTDDTPTSGLSSGAIAGIAVAVSVAVLLLATALGFLFFSRRQKQEAATNFGQSSSTEPITYGGKFRDRDAAPMELGCKSPVEIGSSERHFYLAELATSTHAVSIGSSRPSSSSPMLHHK